MGLSKLIRKLRGKGPRMTCFDVYQRADNPAHVEVIKQGFS